MVKINSTQIKDDLRKHPIVAKMNFEEWDKLHQVLYDTENYTDFLVSELNTIIRNKIDFIQSIEYQRADELETLGDVQTEVPNKLLESIKSLLKDEVEKYDFDQKYQRSNEFNGLFAEEYNNPYEVSGFDQSCLAFDFRLFLALNQKKEEDNTITYTFVDALNPKISFAYHANKDDHIKLGSSINRGTCEGVYHKCDKFCSNDFYKRYNNIKDYRNMVHAISEQEYINDFCDCSADVYDKLTNKYIISSYLNIADEFKQKVNDSKQDNDLKQKIILGINKKQNDILNISKIDITNEQLDEVMQKFELQLDKVASRFCLYDKKKEDINDIEPNFNN